MVERKTPGEIAHLMEKDPAWVSRSIRRIQEDFGTVYPTPREKVVITENLSQLENLYARALSLVSAGTARERAAAIKTALDVLEMKADYEIRIGYVRDRKRGEPSRQDRDDDEQPIPHRSLIAILESVTARQREGGGNAHGGN